MHWNNVRDIFHQNMMLYPHHLMMCEGLGCTSLSRHPKGNFIESLLSLS